MMNPISDVLVGWISAGLQAVHWFNPLIWIAFYRMRVDREIACDQGVLDRVPESKVKAYGETILVLLQRFANGITCLRWRGWLTTRLKWKGEYR